MNTDWLSFLHTELENAPDYPTDSTFLCATEHLGLIQVEGEDALIFLQNQLSNDITHIDDTTCQLNSYSNHKGRMYAIFHVIRYQNGYLLILPKSQIEFLLPRLQMFVIMAKVTLNDVSEQWAKIGFQSIALAQQLLPTDNNVTRTESTLYIRLNPDNPHRILLLTQTTDAQTHWLQLKENLSVCQTNAWQLAQINEGIPSLSPETAEAFVLQMTNLHLLNGVSFKKGCYPGQEIVARTKYLGKAKKRMYLARIKSNTLPLPLEEICEQSSGSADGSGKVVLAAYADEQHCHLLIVANIKKAESTTLKLVQQPEVSLKIKKLPYSFEE